MMHLTYEFEHYNQPKPKVSFIYQTGGDHPTHQVLYIVDSTGAEFVS